MQTQNNIALINTSLFLLSWHKHNKCAFGYLLKDLNKSPDSDVELLTYLIRLHFKLNWFIPSRVQFLIYATALASSTLSVKGCQFAILLESNQAKMKNELSTVYWPQPSRCHWSVLFIICWGWKKRLRATHPKREFHHYLLLVLCFCPLDYEVSAIWRSQIDNLSFSANTQSHWSGWFIAHGWPVEVNFRLSIDHLRGHGVINRSYTLSIFC